jgi:hypothetical protein
MESEADNEGWKKKERNAGKKTAENYDSSLLQRRN